MSDQMMQNATAGTNAAPPNRAAEAALSITRILTGAFFLASSAAIMIVEAGPALFAALLGDVAAQNLTALLLLLTSVAILLRRAVRPAALILAGYVLITGTARIGAGAAFDVLAADMLLLTALLLLAAAEPRRPGLRLRIRRRAAAAAPADSRSRAERQPRTA